MRVMQFYEPMKELLLLQNDSAPVFKFEQSWEQFEPGFRAWMDANWTQTLTYSLIYVLAIFGGRAFMETRDRFELRLPLIIWSTVLAIFSIVGALRTLPEFMSVVQHSGLRASVCSASYIDHPIAGLWSRLFTVSKVYELGDTFFVVLRKQPLIFLHWYHHITVMIYCFHAYVYRNGAGRWFMVMNYLVHSAMYTYYALRAARFRLPRAVNVSITLLQITQMVVGLIVLIYTAHLKSMGHPCDVNDDASTYGLLMYFSYLVLFAKFFYETYLKPKAVDKSKIA